MKLRHVATGLIIERQPPDASEMIRAGTHQAVDSSTTSIVDQLNALSRNELLDLIRNSGKSPHNGEQIDACIRYLIPLVEAGTVVLS